MELISTRFARYRFEARRDEYGVPHVQAASWREALYALGYLHALDRPTQMLFGEVVASGRAAELIADSEELVETDHLFRRAGIHRNLKRETSLLTDSIFDQLTSYCEGVNDGLKQRGRSLPMWATGFQPGCWTQESVLLMGNLLSFGGLAIGQQQSERLLIELIQLGLDRDRLRELFHPRLDEADFDLISQVKISNQLSDEALDLLADLPRLAGSNAWAVSPRRSASGHALLASDPHLEVNRLPAIWYEACLRWADRYVMGATLPGCPLFAVARTQRLAWGVTFMKGDTSDYFVEDCRPGGQTGWQYRRGDQWHDFQLREEQIGRKGRSPEVLRIYENEQGTLECDPDEQGPGRYLSVAWTGSEDGSGRSIAVWLDVTASDCAADAMQIVQHSPHPSLMWVFADSDGHIGLQGTGRFPVRAQGKSGLLPLPAWDEANHWRGSIDPDLLPREYDPPQGFVATANEEVNQPEGPMFVTQHSADYRKRRIVERISELPEATIQDMQSMQYDYVSLHARDLLAVLLPHLPDGDIKNRLAQWDCSYSPESREAPLFQHLYRNVLLEIFGHQQGIGWRRMLYLCTRVGYSTMVLTAIDRLLQQETSLWWQARDKGELIRKAAATLEHEPDLPWSEVNRFHFANRFFEGRIAGRFLGFQTPPLAMPGCHATPFQGHVLKTAARETTFAPSYHFVADLGTDHAWTNLPGGPSESRFSKFYRSDIPRWSGGQYKRLACDLPAEPKQVDP